MNDPRNPYRPGARLTLRYPLPMGNRTFAAGRQVVSRGPHPDDPTQIRITYGRMRIPFCLPFWWLHDQHTPGNVTP